MEHIFLFLCTVWLATAAVCAQNYYNVLPSNDFESFKNSVMPCAVHFITDSPEKLKHDWRMKEFITNFMDAGRYLVDFDVNFATIDCSSDPVEDYCTRDNAKKSLFVFRYSHILTELPMDALYNVDAFVSNMLHLVLLREVPLIHEPVDLAAMQQRLKGHRDILFGKMLAVGTAEHRAFMEGAFAYSHLYQFAMTTNIGSNMLGPGSEAEWEESQTRVWLFNCKPAKSAELCQRSFYRGKMSVPAFALYLKTLDVLPYMEYTESGAAVFYQRLGIPTTYVYSNTAEYGDHRSTVHQLSQKYRGNIGFVLVNSDITPESVVAEKERCQPPCVMLQRDPQEDLILMSADLTQGSVSAFIEDNMYVREEPSEDQDLYDDRSSIPVQEVQDDEVQYAVYTDTRVLEMLHVPKLTDKTFPAFIASEGLVVVLFTVRWDPRCHAFLESYSDAASTVQQSDLPADSRDALTGPFAQVECSNWPDVCQLNNVTVYPTVKLYRQGRWLTDYRGALSQEGIQTSYRLYSSGNPLMLETCADCRALSEGELPHWASSGLNAVVIGYFPDANTRERSAYEQAAKRLQGRHLMAICPKGCARHHSDVDSSEPSVTAFKWGDHHQPWVEYSGGYTASDLTEFVEAATLPLVPELTPSTLPLYYARGKPFLLLFKDADEQSRQAEASLAGLAREKTFESELSVLWIDVSQPSCIGSDILKDYGIKRQPLHPSVVFVDHATSRVCNYPADYSLEAVAMADWVAIVLKGEITCSALRDSKFEPQVGAYDFLALIEETKKLENADQRMGRLATQTDHRHAVEARGQPGDGKTEHDADGGQGRPVVSDDYRHTEL